MLISPKRLNRIWGVNPQSIVHVGAHHAEELESYALAGWGPVTWIEAQPLKVAYLATRIPPHHKLIHAAVWDVAGESMNLKIMTNTESTSLLSLGTHSSEYPSIRLSHTIPVTTSTLENLLNESWVPELLALDIQGVELRAIKGYGIKISKVKWIYCEVNKAELYNGCCLVADIDEYLSQFGFQRVVTRWSVYDWGDALYENSTYTKKRSLVQRVLSIALKASWKAKSPLTNLRRLLSKQVQHSSFTSIQ